MNLKTIALSILTAFAFSQAVAAADAGHPHTHAKKEAGPNGGRLITSLVPHAEFFVTADRKVQITFIDENDQPTAPAQQVVTVTTGSRLAPTKLTFSRSGDVLLSDAALPAGNDFPTVVQIKPSPDAEIVTTKFYLNLSKCPECKLGEYACICDH